MLNNVRDDYKQFYGNDNMRRNKKLNYCMRGSPKQMPKILRQDNSSHYKAKLQTMVQCSLRFL